MRMYSVASREITGMRAGVALFRVVGGNSNDKAAKARKRLAWRSLGIIKYS